LPPLRLRDLDFALLRNLTFFFFDFTFAFFFFDSCFRFFRDAAFTAFSLLRDRDFAFFLDFFGGGVFDRNLDLDLDLDVAPSGISSVPIAKRPDSV